MEVRYSRISAICEMTAAAQLAREGGLIEIKTNEGYKGKVARVYRTPDINGFDIIDAKTGEFLANRKTSTNAFSYAKKWLEKNEEG